MERKNIKIVVIILLVICIAVMTGLCIWKIMESETGAEVTPTPKPPINMDITIPPEVTGIPVVTEFPSITPVPGITQPSVLVEGDRIFIYSVEAKGVLAEQSDMPVLNVTSAVIEDDLLIAGNGARVFTVEVNGTYYRFYNEKDGYLCANGIGNNAFYSKTVSDDADWKIIEGNGGYFLESRTAKTEEKYSQYLEYELDSITTDSMYDVSDFDIYTFMFYPALELLSEGVVNKPNVEFDIADTANKGMEYKFDFQVAAVFGVSEIKVTLGNMVLPCVPDSDGRFIVTIPAEAVQGTELMVRVSGVDVKGVSFSEDILIVVKDEPVFIKYFPARDSETGRDKKPVISVEVVNAGENPSIAMTVNGERVQPVYENGIITYTPKQALENGITWVTVDVNREDGVSASEFWCFSVGTSEPQLYFGQLHSHTLYSDGAGTLKEALEYIQNLPASANIDFVAFTDHSHYFDTYEEPNPEEALYDLSLATAHSRKLWTTYKATMSEFNESQSEVIAIPGFEMTWSSGPGHINTFNTEGIVSRNNVILNRKSGNTGLQAYYSLLSRKEGEYSISQFNHPGTIYGTFIDFAYWDELVDNRIQLVEAGNGTGAIGSGGYSPSYEYYTMALDKGWHVAPTNNQDNHKGKWGNANEARTVILSRDFSEEGLYEAIRNRRVYATEDRNLEIYYTVNDLSLGTIIEKTPEELDIRVKISDPDEQDSIAMVEVIVDSGKTAYAWETSEMENSGEYHVVLEPRYSYYYIRVTEADGDIAVTAPVWIEHPTEFGIVSVEYGSQIPTVEKELVLTTTLYNDTEYPAEVKYIIYMVNGSEVLGMDSTGYTIPSMEGMKNEYTMIPYEAKKMELSVIVLFELDGTEYTYYKDVCLDVQGAE